MILTFLSIYLIARSFKFKNSLIFSLCTWFCLIFFSTEIFSLLKILNSKSLICFWLISCFIAVIWCLVRYFKRKYVINHQITIYDFLNLIFLIWFIILGVTAFLIVPNNYDSMTYHLARVENWIQNSSVDYYATNIPRQLYSPVLAEYVILHTFLLIKSDALANMVQFAAYVISACLLYNITIKLNFQIAIRYFVMTLFITLPMAVAQSVTTQTDLVATMWLLAFINIVLDLSQLKQLTFNRECFLLIIEASVICAFAFLSKGSICIGIICFILWLAWKYLIKEKNWFILSSYGLLSVAIVCILVSPTFYRNYNYTGDIFASDYMEKIAIGNYHFKYIIINLIKNYVLLSAAPLYASFFSFIASQMANLLNIDINNADISWTINFTDEISIVANSYHHDLVSCPYVTILWGICVLIFVWLCYRKKKILNKSFAMTSIMAVLCGLISLRYQMWGSRILLPYCSVMIIFIGCIFTVFTDKHSIKSLLFFLCIGTLVAFSAVKTYAEQTKYLQSNKIKKYFENNKNLYAAYYDLVKYVDLINCNDVGILLDSDTYEYPLWKMLSNKKIIQVVEGENNLDPECIIAVNQNIMTNKTVIYSGKKFNPVYFYQDNPDFVVLRKKGMETITINFTKYGNAHLYAITGLSTQEKTHIWSDAKNVDIDIDTEYLRKFIDINKIILTLEAFPFVAADILQQTVKVYANNQLIAIWQMKQRDIYSAVIPAEVVNSKHLTLRFEISNPASPKKLGISEDSRQLGIAFEKLTISPLSEKEK